MTRIILFLRLAVVAGSVLCLAGCDDGSGDPNAEIGPNPKLPEVQQYLLPPMHIAKVVGWKQGDTPSVAKGLKIQAMATGLQHPRSLYVLPNGDILVIESKAPQSAAIKRPKEIIMGYIESWATSGGDAGPSNRITLLRDSNGDGVPDMRSVFLDHLNSPFGVALQGIRENPERMRLLGNGVTPHLVVAFTISAAVAGLAGALLTQTSAFVGLGVLSLDLSFDVLVMLVLGGVGSLYGALVGTPLYMLLKHFSSQWSPFYWMFAIGVLLIAVVLLGRGGVLGSATAAWRYLSRRSAA